MIDPHNANKTHDTTKPTHLQAEQPASPSMAQFSSDRALLPPGLDTIQAFASYGFPLMGCYPSGAAYRSGEDYRNGFTKDANRIQDLWTGKGDPWGHGRGSGIRLFRFEPGQGGFLCMDLDRNHKDGADGIQELLGVFRTNGLVLPSMFKSLEAGSFPCYTLTPSGGLHLYFRYKGIRRYVHQFLAPAVEVFHFGNLLTAPGSIKEGKGGYTLMGSLDDAPLFPGILERLLKMPATHESKPPKPVFSFLQAPPPKDQPSMEALAQWATQDGEGGGRNALCHAIAKRAARPEYRFTRSEVVAFLNEYPATAGHDQIETTVDSAFRHRGK
jgi:hypothetical protein